MARRRGSACRQQGGYPVDLEAVPHGAELTLSAPFADSAMCRLTTGRVCPHTAPMARPRIIYTCQMHAVIPMERGVA